MGDQIIDLNNLIKRYKNELEQLERKRDALERKMDVAYQALQLLKDEGATDQDLFQPETKIIPESLSEKYKNMSMRKAISDILKSHEDEYLTGKQIYNELTKHGFQSKSKNLQRDVYVQLYRLQKENQIIEDTEGTYKRYKWPSSVGNTMQKAKRTRFIGMKEQLGQRP
ncbi:MAG: hypothetical protein ACW98X_26395 [Promethearchaeota archaeon]|jgi:hypothetical protein